LFLVDNRGVNAMIFKIFSTQKTGTTIGELYS
jgi:hypothetical protein